ncbi:MAG: GntR family transcriptional regulator [Coriobacteriaceae bacterium]|jgi:DNA-binding transcriptional regulator YhcF (GntR family)|nr:GntR family transcriptional regulator [Coriobacteriaceae bacterium]
MRPTLDNDRPLFLQIKEAIEGDILSGLLVPDDQIPSNSQLVSFFGINPVTVHKGVSLLLDEGIVYKKRGLGMFVSQKAPELLRKKRQAGFQKDYIEPLVFEAKNLALRSEDIHALIEEVWGKE